MALHTKEIKSRIKTVGNVKKITKAMELVSAVKMRKAIYTSTLSKAFADKLWQVVLRLSLIVDSGNAYKYPLLRTTQQKKKIAVVVFSSNRSLCGNFNILLAEKARLLIEEQKCNGIEVDIVTYGKKGREYLEQRGYSIIADFTKPDLISRAEELTALNSFLIDRFSNHTYDEIHIVYMRFQSALVQVPETTQFLPIQVPHKDDAKEINIARESLFEPNKRILLNKILPEAAEIKLYQSVLDTNASEHSARMFAMKNATDAANDMMTTLRMLFNRARQASITQEVAEISAGTAALE